MSKSAETKREEFRKYLESNGILDALTKVLVGLYEEPEKPMDPLEFVKKHLHGGPPESIDTDALQQRVRELEEQNKKLENELTVVKQQLAKYEGSDASGGTTNS
ncbi:c-Myc-binding protein homolog [Dysidea avara]|uniref:c-Myc-binding protein homolog n=1 Tax=Dysidea avara TaxID=196820 RepID=UPI00332D3851